MHVTFNDHRQAHFIGYFKVSTHDDWLTISKMHESGEIFATLIYFRPMSCVWQEHKDKPVANITGS